MSYDIIENDVNSQYVLIMADVIAICMVADVYATKADVIAYCIGWCYCLYCVVDVITTVLQHEEDTGRCWLP